MLQNLLYISKAANEIFNDKLYKLIKIHFAHVYGHQIRKLVYKFFNKYKPSTACGIL